MPIEGWWRFDSGDEHIRLFFHLLCDDKVERVCDPEGNNCHVVPKGQHKGLGKLIMQSRFSNDQLTDLGSAYYDDAYEGPKDSYTAVFLGNGYSLTPHISYDQSTDKLLVEMTVGTPHGGGAYGTYTLTRSTVSFETGTDRFGADYKNIEMNAFSPWFCEAACAFEKRCRAFTLVPPGVKGPKSHCYLKDRAMGKSPAPGMISGEKQSRP